MLTAGRACLLAVLLLLVPLLPVRAQEEEQRQAGDVRVGITYEPGYIPGLAMPAARSGDEALEATAARVDSILRRDLAYSDRFQMLPLPDTLERSSGIRYSFWNELGAVWVVSAEVSGSPDAPVLRLSLHDVVYESMEDVQAFDLPSPGSDGFRMAVHRASDALVRWATGEPGMAATRIAFRRKREDRTADIYMVDSDGRGLRRVTHDSSIVYSPAFSPDGDRLLYVSYVEGHPVVYERSLRSGDARVVSARPGVNLTPTYRPDGRRILVARSVDRTTQIFSLETEPLCCPSQVTYTAPGDALNPSYSPDGGRIAFTSTSLGEPQVYVQVLPGGGPALVSEYVYGERGQSTAPEWSPEGDRIAYQTWVDGDFQIATVNPDGTDRRILTARGSNEEPSWAPDGRHLVFRSDRDGSHALWVLDTVTGNLRRLVSGHEDQTPDWSGPLPPPRRGGARTGG